MKPPNSRPGDSRLRDGCPGPESLDRYWLRQQLLRARDLPTQLPPLPAHSPPVQARMRCRSETNYSRAWQSRSLPQLALRLRHLGSKQSEIPREAVRQKSSQPEQSLP